MLGRPSLGAEDVFFFSRIGAGAMFHMQGVPFALDIDPVPPETAARVEALADECDIRANDLSQRAGDAAVAASRATPFGLPGSRGECRAAP